MGSITKTAIKRAPPPHLLGAAAGKSIIQKISPRAHFVRLVCGFPNGTLSKVASLRSFAVSAQSVEPRQGSASLAHAK